MMIKRNLLAAVMIISHSIILKSFAQLPDLVPSFGNEILLAKKTLASLDTTCVANATTSYDPYTQAKSCGVIYEGVKNGKWLEFDSNGKLDYITLYDRSGKDSININWVPSRDIPGSISFYKNGNFWIEISYFKDSLDAVTMVYADTLLQTANFYASGKIRSYGFYYRHPSPPSEVFMRDNLGYDIGTGKHGLWQYLNEDGSLNRTEEYKYGNQVK